MFRTSQEVIYKVAPGELWSAAESAGQFTGAAIDLADGYIHLSAAHQVAQTLEKHFAGQVDLRLIAVSTAVLGDRLHWEPSRGGDLFPHLYGILPLDAVVSVQELSLDDDGKHILPAELCG